MGVCRYARHAAHNAGPEASNKEMDDWRFDIFLALTQGRNPKSNNVQTKIQVAQCCFSGQDHYNYLYLKDRHIV
jgi:hypothetical protein